jgi:MFS family permease
MTTGTTIETIEQPLSIPLKDVSHHAHSHASFGAPLVTTVIENSKQKSYTSATKWGGSGEVLGNSISETVVPLQLNSSRPNGESFEDDDDGCPDGGKTAWRVVAGSFLGLFATSGLLNSVGAVQAYISSNQLATKTDSQISWIFSVMTFLTYILSGLSGPLFDAYGPLHLGVIGTGFLVTGIMAASACTEYYQFLLSLGICLGIGLGLLVGPLFAIIGHWFNTKRALATGTASVGASFGGVVFPILLRHLYSTIGFAWGVRVVGFMSLSGLTFAMLLIKSRFAKTSFHISVTNFVDLRSLRDMRFLWLIVANLLAEISVMNSITFLASYALAQNKSQTLAYASLTILSASGMVARWASGILADKIGRFNTLIILCIQAFVTVFAIWLPFGHTTAGLIIFSVLHGASNGSIFSLFPVCCSQICRTKDYGKRYGTMFFFASFGVLVGIPLSGALIRDHGKDYTYLIVFTGCLYVITTISLLLSRTVSIGWKLCKI